MKIVGLIGGIASGKTAVAVEFAALGAEVLDADKAAHEVINLPSVQQALVARWGPEILKLGIAGAPDAVDRGAVASRVFSNQESGRRELRFLEETLHPRIRQRFEAELSKLAAAGTAVAVIDAPLLLEAGWETLCDCLVFVDSPPTERLRRASLRNWTEQEFVERESCQMTIAAKRQRATHVLANSGTLANLRNQVRAFWASLEAAPKRV